MAWLWLCWLLLPVLGLFAVLEWRGFHDAKEGTTLSATWWRIRHLLWLRVLVFAAVSWLLWHLLCPWDLGGIWWDDYSVMAVAGVLGALTKYPARGGA